MRPVAVSPHRPLTVERMTAQSHRVYANSTADAVGGAMEAEASQEHQSASIGQPTDTTDSASHVCRAQRALGISNAVNGPSGRPAASILFNRIRFY